ncbi:MAG: hypothetical protein OXG35_13450 [Acidobacteria bacterium]|nr:hypothetical protein [Acidobacteriota bacterium]
MSERAAPAPHVETSSKPEPMPVQHRMTRLERDLAVIDAEWLTDQWGGREIIALAVRRLRPDGGGYARTWHFKPSGQVDDASRQVHGLTTEALGRAPAFEDCKSAVLESLKDADIGGYDVRNDVTLLEDALTAGGTSWPPTDVRLVDGLRIWQNAEPRSLAAGYRRFAGTAQAPQAHDPRNDAEMASAVIEALAPNLTAGQIENATDPGRLDPAGKLRRDENGQVVFNFGKHRGRRALDHSDFLFWMLKRDFTQSTRNVVLELLENGDPLEPPRATGERNDSDDDSLPF